MRKLENLERSLDVLKKADFDRVGEDEIYRTGIVGQFQLTFELAWKALQAVLRLYSVREAEQGSPREILKLGYRCGFVEDAEVWLLMLKKRNHAVHMYNETETDELVELIQTRFIKAFTCLAETLRRKVQEAETDYWK